MVSSMSSCTHCNYTIHFADGKWKHYFFSALCKQAEPYYVSEKETNVPKTTMHEYISDPQSGAGNCKTCQQPERYVDHFHKFVPAQVDPNICTCLYTEKATCHMDMVWVSDEEVVSRGVLGLMAIQNANKNGGEAMNCTYDVVIVAKGETHIFKKKTLSKVNEVMRAIDEDRVFSLNDDQFRICMFKPNEIEKVQFNLVESWTR